MFTRSPLDSGLLGAGLASLWRALHAEVETARACLPPGKLVHVGPVPRPGGFLDVSPWRAVPATQELSSEPAGAGGPGPSLTAGMGG